MSSASLYNVWFYAVAERDGIPIFMREQDAERPDQIYVMVRAKNCDFRAYKLVVH